MGTTGEATAEELQRPASEHDSPTSHTASAMAKKGKLTLLPLIFLIYFEVAGGPFGEEPAVKAAGPLFAIIGFLIFPFIWSIPEALITAELSTTFPGNGGFVIWADRAFGPFSGSFMGFTKYLSGVINTASFPLLCISYLQNLIPFLSSGLPRTLSLLLSTFLLSFLNFTGLNIVGYASILLGLLSLSPFILLSIAALPRLRPRRWLRRGRPPHDWTLFFNTLFWNLNFWDNISTIAGEVDDPQRTLPRAMFAAVILTCTAYVVPLMAVVGAVEVDQRRWESGFFAEAAEIVGGRWMKVWMEVGAVLSAVGLYEAQLSSCSFGLVGMAELGFIPRVFERRSRWFKTPWVGILLSTVVAAGISCMDFTDVISGANFMYSVGMLLEFACFLWLRRKKKKKEVEVEEMAYVVPLGMPWLVVMCLVPSVFLVYVMVIATRVVFLMSGVMTAAVICLYFVMNQCRERGWMCFNEVGWKEG